MFAEQWLVHPSDILTSNVDDSAGQQQGSQEPSNQCTPTLFVFTQILPGESNIRVRGQHRVRSPSRVSPTFVVEVVVDLFHLEVTECDKECD